MSFSLIPSLDLLSGRVVRLVEGDFQRVTFYDDAHVLMEEWPAGTLVHVVDLEGSRSGKPIELEFVRRLVGRGFRVQVGGGVRSVEDARNWLDSGASRVVIGTLACEDPLLFRSIIESIGPDRVLPAVDLRDSEIRVSGWERAARQTLDETLRLLEDSGCREVLVTDVRRDGKLDGPSFALYRELAGKTSLRVIASGGVRGARDVAALSNLSNLSGVVVGKALLERRMTLGSGTATTLPPRVIPCLDVRDCRVAKGVAFENLRDAGDPAQLAARYEKEGADEVVVLDITATTNGRATALETARRVADALFIPLTVGGGVRTVDDFRLLLRAGADRVAVNSAAVKRPSLLRELSSEFGTQAVVMACDVRQVDGRDEVMTAAGQIASGLDAVSWCRRAEELGAGEILLTSIDRDGSQSGFDTGLLRRVSSAVGIGVIASGGAGTLEHFRAAIEEGGAAAVLAASLFHDRALSIEEVKLFLAQSGIAMRGVPDARI